MNWKNLSFFSLFLFFVNYSFSANIGFNNFEVYNIKVIPESSKLFLEGNFQDAISNSFPEVFIGPAGDICKVDLFTSDNITCYFNEYPSNYYTVTLRWGEYEINRLEFFPPPSSPKITLDSIYSNSSSSSYDVHFNGYFGNNSDEIEIRIGGTNNCPITIFSPSSLVCHLDGTTYPYSGGLTSVLFRIGRYVNHTTVNFAPRPPYHVSNVSIYSNLKYIQISGNFGDLKYYEVTVKAYNSTCYVYSSSNNAIYCNLLKYPPVPGYYPVVINFPLNYTYGKDFYYPYLSNSINNMYPIPENSSMVVYGSFNISLESQPRIYINGSLCIITQSNLDYIECFISKYREGFASFTLQMIDKNGLVYFYNDSTIYLPPIQPLYYLDVIYGNPDNRTIVAAGFFGNSRYNVSVSFDGYIFCPIVYFSSSYLVCSLGYNYPTYGGYYNTSVVVSNYYFYRVAYFPPISNHSSSSSDGNSTTSSASSSEDSVECTLTPSGKLKVKYDGLINCTSQGVTDCYSSNGTVGCHGLTVSSSTRCTALNEIVCSSQIITCNAGRMTCSQSGGSLIIVPGNPDELSDPSITHTSGSSGYVQTNKGSILNPTSTMIISLIIFSLVFF